MKRGLSRVLDTLDSISNIRARVLEGQPPPATDALILIETPQGHEQYAAEVRDYISRDSLPVVTAQLRYNTRCNTPRTLLVSRYLSEPVIDALLEAGVEFVDAAGNMYLNSAVGFVLIRGRKQRPASEHTDASPFTLAGLKVVYALLRTPQLRNAPYREIQEAAGVALGTLSKTIKALSQERYLVRTRSGTLHLDFLRLLERWELGYIEQVRPKLKPTSWRLHKGQTIDGLLDAARLNQGYLVGGELAAARLTNLLRPETVTLYVPESRHKRAPIDLKLLPAEGTAQVYILTHFAHQDQYDDTLNGQGALLDPLMIRAELLALGGDRLQEVANELLQRVLLPREQRAREG